MKDCSRLPWRDLRISLHMVGPSLDLASLAAAYAYGIARDHPFVDGNKRTALVVARTFLILNGVDLEATQNDKFLTFLDLAEGAISEEELADWIRKRIQS
jgi:death on curing protein